jgi:hypothetical protein
MTMPRDSRTYYEVLHVSRDAPTEIIRGSYRTLMQQLRHHPDLGGDTSTAALINEAYAVLSNAERRAKYDEQLDLLSQVAEGSIGETIKSAPPAARPTERRPIDLSRECAFCESPHTLGSVLEADSACNVCGSPLFPAAQKRMESAGKRAVERIGKRQDAVFYTRWPQQAALEGHIEDISLNGLRLVTGHHLHEGQRIKIVSDVVEAIAYVSHALHERRGWKTHCVAGVSFLTLRFGRSVGGFVSSRV